MSPEEFAEFEGARAYLHYLLGLGRTLWLLGNTAEAIARLREILRLAPVDPDHARYFLFNYLLLEGTPEALGRLLRQYRHEHSARWLYTRALWAFRRWGKGLKARAAIAKALGRSPRVPEYLLGRRPLPESIPNDIPLGSEEEAVHYAAFAEEAWQETPGALEWLSGSVPAPAPASAVYQLRVVLRGSEPRIWRRLLVRADTTLPRLHDVIQRAIGWDDDHMHQFRIAGTVYHPMPDQLMWTRAVDESRVRLYTAMRYAKAAGLYEYDFGDSWTHELLVEKVLEREPGAAYPICIAGKRLGPPEDSGGVWGYSHLVAAYEDEDHPDHERAIEWLGEDFDPDDFDVKDVNARLERLR